MPSSSTHADIILHHYQSSPFSEKVRLILGFKGLSWKSVIIPAILPKPDVVALTGGYRRTPFMQIGADIYCDTALIADTLERLHPTPTLYPADVEGASRLLAEWADSALFWTAIPYSMQPEGTAHMFAGAPPEAMKAFGADRAAMRANAPRMRPPEAIAGMRIYLARLSAMLSDGRKFLMGAHASIADFSVYHCLWFITRSGSLAAILDLYPSIVPWMHRMKAFGHGTYDKLDSESAVEIARDAVSATRTEEFVDVHGVSKDAPVTITPTDYALDPVQGTLVLARANEVAICRMDERAGEVVVHFPRIGYQMREIR